MINMANYIDMDFKINGINVLGSVKFENVIYYKTEIEIYT